MFFAGYNSSSIYPEKNSVSWRAFIAIDDPILRNVHDSNSLELCVVSYGS